MFTAPYPETSWQIPWMHSLFGNAAAVATGVAAAMRVLGREETRVVAQGGDGGTTDIGFGCLSGMFERNDDVLYICYDNEGYRNTGVQRSSATPPRTSALARRPLIRPYSPSQVGRSFERPIRPPSPARGEGRHSQGGRPRAIRSRPVASIGSAVRPPRS